MKKAIELLSIVAVSLIVCGGLVGVVLAWNSSPRDGCFTSVGVGLMFGLVSEFCRLNMRARL